MDSLTVPVSFDSLKPLRVFVQKAAAGANLDYVASYNLCLAVDEIATNIIMHGYADVTPTQADFIQAEASIDGQVLKIGLLDKTKSYDLSQALPLQLTVSLGERLPGGWGIYLARQSVDELFYERVGEYNHIIFVVSIQSK